MADKRDYYEVLGVSKSATTAEIKSAYRKIAKKYHPDVDPSEEATKIFREASEAYAVLSDDEKRKQYDQFGHAAFDQGAGGQGFDFSGFDFGDIFGGGFGDIFGDLFGSRGRGSSRRSSGPMRGRDLRYGMTISFEEAVFGCNKEITINFKDTCKTCGGSGAKPGTSPVTCSKCGGSGQYVSRQQTIFGMMQNVSTCPDCNGSGKVINEKCPDCYGKGYKDIKKKITVNVPKGIDDKNSLRIQGEGEPGVNGGPRGDLLVNIRVTPSKEFERNMRELYNVTHISFAQAAMGGDIRVKTVDGDVKFKISPGTQNGTRIRLKGKGVFDVHNPNFRGDQYSTIVVDIPKHLSNEQREIIKQFDAVSGNTLKEFDGDTTTPDSSKKKGFFKK